MGSPFLIVWQSEFLHHIKFMLSITTPGVIRPRTHGRDDRQPLQSLFTGDARRFVQVGAHRGGQTDSPFLVERGRRGLQVAPVDRARFDAIFELRSALEPLAASLAAARASKEQIAAGKAIVLEPFAGLRRDRTGPRPRCGLSCRPSRTGL